MSYNITSWRTQELSDLQVPMSALYSDTIRRDWRLGEPQMDLSKEGLGVKIKLPVDRGELEGSLSADRATLSVSKLEIAGEGSGTFLGILEPALRLSTGTLKARLIWEGGDSTSNLIVENGKYSNDSE